MKYHSISLRNEKSIGFLKYKGRYESLLNECCISDETKKTIKLYSGLMSINSNHQAFLITENNTRCFGCIIIDQKSFDNETLQVEMEIDKSKFDSIKEISKLLFDVIESIKLFYYDYKRIEIKILNNNDYLIDYNYPTKGINQDIYVIDNTNINKIYTALVKEITDCNQDWLYKINYLDNKKYEFDNFFDKEMMNELRGKKLRVEDIFYRLNAIELSDIFLKNFERNIVFNTDGNIQFSKVTRKKHKKNYEFNYNVVDNNFRFSNKNIKIEDTNDLTEIDINSIHIKYLKKSGKTIYNYITPIIDNSSVSIEIVTDEYNHIDRCYMDFKTFKGNKKINGIYALRINKEKDYYKLNFLNRSGSRECSIFNKLKSCDNSLYSQIINDSIDLSLLDELLNKVIRVINIDSNNKLRKKFILAEPGIISYMYESYKDVIEFISRITREIPLPHLYRLIATFIDKQKYHLNNNSQTSKKLLKLRKN